MNLNVDYVYICGSLIGVDIHDTAADAERHVLHVTMIEDCLGFGSVKKHKEAIRQIIDTVGVDGIGWEEVVMDLGSRPERKV